MKNEIGIYIHIPFCRSKCFYCDFCSEPLDEKKKNNESLVEEYIDALCKEIIENADILSTHNITSIYIGGGTPTSIDAKYIKQIMDILNMFNVSETSENTIELNPIDCTKEKLTKYINIGINRVSVGIQSTNTETLKKIGRLDKVFDINEMYKNISKSGFKNISLDLIIGLPEETMEMFKNTVEDILALGENIKHISAYSLEIHENTKLDFLLKNNFLHLPSEDIERDMKHFLDDRLEEKGFVRYEISNYAYEGFESKHNLKYWTSIEYIGFGAAASSYILSTRYTNTSDIKKYISNILNNLSVRESVEQLSEPDAIKEHIILRLRLKEGVNKEEFKKIFKRDIYDLYGKEIKELKESGLLTQNKSNIYLSNKGEDMANIVWQQFI